MTEQVEAYDGVLIPSSSGLKAGLDYDVETGEFFVLIPSSSGLKAGQRAHVDDRRRYGLNPFFIRSQGRTDHHAETSVLDWESLNPFFIRSQGRTAT